jgi:hypothetical protein
VSAAAAVVRQRRHDAGGYRDTHGPMGEDAYLLNSGCLAL